MEGHLGRYQGVTGVFGRKKRDRILYETRPERLSTSQDRTSRGLSNVRENCASDTSTTRESDLLESDPLSTSAKFRDQSVVKKALRSDWKSRPKILGIKDGLVSENVFTHHQQRSDRSVCHPRVSH